MPYSLIISHYIIIKRFFLYLSPILVRPPKPPAPCVVPTISQGTVIPMHIEPDPNITTTYAPPTLSTITNKVQHGTTLDVVCVNQYEFPVSTLAAPTCNNGTWSVIPRCVPARCKGLPKAPKFGMVLAPKTEHGMKARFKCKDGFNLTGPGGKEITDMNAYVLTCSFGNWTGEMPQCQEVYCSFPGYIEHGKILLVGNMGLYDYRPYVKKIINNKQIMYDCDKGYVLGDGPPGATCVGGLWRPTELPKCLLGQHPRLRWNRRRRSLEMRYARSRALLSNYRHLQRYVGELLQLHDGPEHEQLRLNRTRRASLPHRRDTAGGNFGWPAAAAAATMQLTAAVAASVPAATAATIHHQHGGAEKRQRFQHSADHVRVSRTLAVGSGPARLYRQQRQPFHGDEAYGQYMKQIRQRYQQYVRNLLGRGAAPALRLAPVAAPPVVVVPAAGAHSGGNNFSGSHKSNAQVARGSPASRHRDVAAAGADLVELKFENDLFKDSKSAAPGAKPAGPAKSWQQHSQRRPAPNGSSSGHSFFASNQYEKHHHRGSAAAAAKVRPLPKPDATDYIAVLQSQLMRRRRRKRDTIDAADADALGNNGSTGSNALGRKNGRRNLNATAATAAAAAVTLPPASTTAPAPAALDAEAGEIGPDGQMRGKPKSPCQAIEARSFMQLDVVREGRDPSVENSAGTIIRATCAKEYTLNLQNPNGTVKCVRGRWKPQLPECTLRMYINGNYFGCFKFIILYCRVDRLWTYFSHTI